MPNYVRNPEMDASVTIVLEVVDAATTLTIGDGKAACPIPSWLDGFDIVDVELWAETESSSGIPTVQIARIRDSGGAGAPTVNDVLSTKVTIDATHNHSKNASTPMVVNATYDDLLEGDALRADCDVAGTGTKGVRLVITCRLP